MTLVERLMAQAAGQQAAPCFPELEAGTWGPVGARVAGIASALAEDRGRVVAIAMPEGPDFALAILGAMAAGAIALPIAATATAHERERLLAGLDVARVITASPTGAGEAPPPVEPGAIALLVGTSGSTGQPKRVALSHAALTWNAEAHAASLGLAHGTRTLMVSSLAHAFPLVAVCLGTLAIGGSVAWLGGTFTPRGLARRIDEAAIDYVALTPTLLRLLVARAADARLPGVLSVGAGPIPAGELVEAAAWARDRGCRLYHTYGLSEAGPRVATLAPEDIPARAASVGKPLPGVRVRVVEGGRDCPAHTPGEVWLWSPSLMAGYFPEGGGLAEDGWLATGDLGYMDADGFLHLRGRLKDVIVTGGTTVGAGEIEAALMADAAVAEAAVVGLPDPDYGEVACAFVVLSAPATPHELMGRLSAVLSRHKLPRRLTIVESLPRTSLGKVNKQRLKEAACAGSP